MITASTPEVRSLIVVFAVVLATAGFHAGTRIFDRLDTVEAQAQSGENAAEELQEKVDDLANQVEELQEKLRRSR